MVFTSTVPLVHHVQGDDHGDVHFQQLHGQVKVALDVRGVHDVDDRFRVLVQDKVAGDQLLTGIGRHGIDPGQVRDQGIRVPADDAVLAVHGDAGEVADVLVGAGQLVEERGFSAVLVADEGEGQRGPFRKGVARTLGMETAFLTEAGVLRGLLLFLFSGCGSGCFRAFQQGDTDVPGIRDAEGQLISVDPKLHGIAHWCQLDQGCLGAGDNAHVQEMLAQGAFAADGLDAGGLAGFQLIQFHHFQRFRFFLSLRRGNGSGMGVCHV